MIKEEDLFKIGQFAKPRGIKGEIMLVTDYEPADISGDPFIVCNVDGIWVPFFFKSYRQNNASSAFASFENIDSEDKVKLLTGKTAFITAERITRKDDEFISAENFIGYRDFKQGNKNAYHRLTAAVDLTGYTVIDDRIGTVGPVIDVNNSTLNILLTVDHKGSEILIPIALATSIQQKCRTINLSLPEGFLKLYYEKA